MITFHIPGDPLRSEVIGLSDFKDLIHDLLRKLFGMAESNGPFPDQSFSAAFNEFLFPVVIGRSWDSEFSTALFDFYELGCDFQNQ
jgi:hypothetical protein